MPVASLRVTVWLFALSLFLVFAGTLAQAESGNLTVVHEYFRSYTIVWVPFQIFVKFGQVFLGISPEATVAGSFPFPGGWLLGGLLLANLLTAHLVRFRVTWKRTGILLIHSGLVVMMLSELITGLYAVEGHMAIMEGDSVNYVNDNHKVELAVIDRSNPTTDDVVAIPGSLLKAGGTIRTGELPFDIRVEKYMVNSQLAQAKGGMKNPATAGDGLDWVALPRPEVSGTDTDDADVASVYVTVLKKGSGEPVGTYLLTLFFNADFRRRTVADRPQHIAFDGKDYALSLRPHRTYRDFSVRLLEFRHDRFLGTTKAKNFSSLVRLVDPGENEEREVKIWMNHPLRYGGETFYQSSVLPGDGGTVLQVVRNPGWLMPYVSCLMVALGMIVHFGLHLMGFLSRRAVP
jgi:hypothetical protein